MAQNPTAAHCVSRSPRCAAVCLRVSQAIRLRIASLGHKLVRAKATNIFVSEGFSCLTSKPFSPIESNLHGAYERRVTLLRIRSISPDQSTQKNGAHSSAPILATRNCMLTGGRVGTAITVIGTDIIFIIGTVVIAGSVHQAGDRM